MNFKEFLFKEMAHIMNRANGQPQPIKMDKGYAISLDMKFEHYPDQNFKKKLLAMGSKFYGKMPGEDAYLVFDGNNASRSSLPPEGDEFLKLPDYWYDYALIEFVDGSIKNSIAGN